MSYLLVAGGKRSQRVDGLLQLLLFRSSAVAELSSRTNIRILHYAPQSAAFTTTARSHRSLLHEAGEELVDVRASLQEALSRLLRLLLGLVGGHLQPSLQGADAATLEPQQVDTQ